MGCNTEGHMSLWKLGSLLQGLSLLTAAVLAALTVDVISVAEIISLTKSNSWEKGFILGHIS